MPTRSDLHAIERAMRHLVPRQSVIWNSETVPLVICIASLHSMLQCLKSERGPNSSRDLGDSSQQLEVVTWPQVENLTINLLRTRINLNYI